jgi:hypothetical protein
MKTANLKSKVLKIAGLSLLVVLSVPIGALGQGRWRGENNGWGRKCERFVNCHDARDGRWDHRGPRRVSTWNQLFWQRRNNNFDRVRRHRWNEREWGRSSFVHNRWRRY